MLLAVTGASLLLVAVWVLPRFIKLFKHYQMLHLIPSPDTGRGHLAALGSLQRHKTMLRWAKECGPVFLLRLLWVRVVVVSDPVLVSQVLSRKADANKPAVWNIINELFSACGHPSISSSLDSKSPYWRLVRKGTAPAFNPNNLRRGFDPAIAAALEVCDVIKSVGDCQSVDIDNLLVREALDVIGKVGFNHDFKAVQGYTNQTHGDAFYHASKGLEEFTLRATNPLRQYLKFLPSVRRGKAHYRAFQAHMELLLKTLKANGPPADDDMSLAAHLLRLRDPFTGAPLSNERLLPEIATFFIAGFDTTGHTMAWTLYLLSRHPEAEARVCQELEEHGLLATHANPSPRLVEYEDLAKLVFLSACIKESMRLIPVTAEASSRCFPYDVRLGGQVIPANTWIWCYIYAVQRSPSVWADPDSYIPERWLEPGAEYFTPPEEPVAGLGSDQLPSSTHLRRLNGSTTQKTSVTDASRSTTQKTWQNRKDTGSGAAELPRAERALRFLPFSSGPRDCIGQNLSKLNYMATLAVLLGRFSFRLAPEMEGPGGVQEVIKLTLQPANGIRMLCTPRA
ncbi:hypothetical protein N2152v2_002835 [Parachlorella kessleri]